MKKLKIIWRDNKVVVVLVSILFLCFIAICFIAATYFFGGDSSVYGDRLEGSDEYKISSKEEDDYIDTLILNESVEDATFKVHGKIIYVSVNFAIGTDLEAAKTVLTASLESMEEKWALFYDVNFTINCDKSVDTDGFVLMGAKNIGSEVIVWNNNTPIEESE